METNLSDKIRDFVTKDNLEDAARLLKKTRFYSEGIHQLARLAELKKKTVAGSIRVDDERIEKARIRESLLEVAGKLDKNGEGELHIFLNKKIYVIVLISGTILFLYYWFSLGISINPNFLCINEYRYSVAIADFSLKKDGLFQGRILGNLDEKISLRDSIGLDTIAQHIMYNPTTIGLATNEIKKRKCIDSGLVVYGRLSKANEMLDCYTQLVNLNPPRLKLKGDFEHVRITEASLKVPEPIEFSIPKHAERISDFIIGLLYYYMEDPAKSITFLKKAIKDSNSFEDFRYYKICNIVLGNCYQLQNKPDSAIFIYNQLINTDSVDPLIFWNLSIAYHAIGEDTLSSNAILNFLESNVNALSENERQVINQILYGIELLNPAEKIEDTSSFEHLKIEKRDSNYLELINSRSISLSNDSLDLFPSVNSSLDLDLGKQALKANHAFTADLCSANGEHSTKSNIQVLDDNTIISICEHGIIKKWDIYGNQVNNLGKLTNETILAFSSDKRTFFTINRLYEVKQKNLYGKEIRSFPKRLGKTLSKYKDPIFLQNEQSFLLVEKNNAVKLIDEYGNSIRKFSIRGEMIDPKISTNGEWILVASENGVKLYDASGKVIHRYYNNKVGKIYDIAFLAEGKKILLAKYIQNHRQALQICDHSGNILESIGIPLSPNGILDFSSDGNLCVIINRSGIGLASFLNHSYRKLDNTSTSTSRGFSHGILSPDNQIILIKIYSDYFLYRSSGKYVGCFSNFAEKSYLVPDTSENGKVNFNYDLNFLADGEFIFSENSKKGIMMFWNIDSVVNVLERLNE